MKRIVFVVLLCLTFVESLLAQDTIRVEPSIFYFKEKNPHGVRGFVPNYAREDIVFSETHKKIEYCHYYDGERRCFGRTYTIVNDSILQIEYPNDFDSTERWTYKKVENRNYHVYRYYNGSFESGEVSELMPFTRLNDFIVMTQDKQDTLWIANYERFNLNKFTSYPEFRLVKATVEGKIYELKEVEQRPTLLNGAALPKTIKGVELGGCYDNEADMFIRKLSFIVTADGRIKNIQQEWGNITMPNCPQGLLKLMLKVMNQFGQLKPANHLGKNVNVRYVIDVERI